MFICLVFICLLCSSDVCSTVRVHVSRVYLSCVLLSAQHIQGAIAAWQFLRVTAFDLCTTLQTCCVFSGKSCIQERVVDQQPETGQTSRSKPMDARSRIEGGRRTHGPRTDQLHRARQFLRRPSSVDGRPRKKDEDLWNNGLDLARKGTE